MNKFASSVNGLVWTLAGTALVLITLSGETKKIGIAISVVALVINVIGILFEGEE
jgi:hypothetical protein